MSQRVVLKALTYLSFINYECVKVSENVHNVIQNTLILPILISREFALATGFQMISADCTSHYSAKAAERNGFQSVHSIAYTDYMNEHGKIVFKTDFPHTHAHVYVLHLQQHSQGRKNTKNCS